MTFRQAALTLAAPVLSIALVGCQPPLEEKKEGGAAAPTATEPSTAAPTVAPTATDVKPTEPAAPAAPAGDAAKEAPATTTTPAPAPTPEEPKKDDMPKS